MKKLLFAAVILMAFASCEKTEMEPTKVKLNIDKISYPIEWYINLNKGDTVTYNNGKK